jgi:uncharacterized protein YbjQ (UPF0145 family)
MMAYTVGTLPDSHKRARDILRKRWSKVIDDTSTAWTALSGAKPTVLAVGADALAVVTPGLAGAEYAISYSSVEDVSVDGRRLVLVIAPGHHLYEFLLDDPRDAPGVAEHVGSMTERLESKRSEWVERRRALTDMLIVTTESVPGFEIVKVHGDVLGVVVRARNVFSNMGARMRTVVGGEAAAYTKLLTESRNEARERLAWAALEKGANAVVAMRYESSEIADLMSEVAAYGTAVTIRPGNSTTAP